MPVKIWVYKDHQRTEACLFSFMFVYLYSIGLANFFPLKVYIPQHGNLHVNLVHCIVFT